MTITNFGEFSQNDRTPLARPFDKAPLLDELYRLCVEDPESASTEDAYLLYIRAVDAFPNHPDPYFCMGCLHCWNKQYLEAIPLLEHALETWNAGADTCGSRFPLHLEYLYLRLCLCYEVADAPGTSFRYAAQALLVNPRSELALDLLLSMLTEKFPVPLPDLIAFLEKVYDFEDPDDLAFLKEHAKQIGNRSLLEYLECSKS